MRCAPPPDAAYPNECCGLLEGARTGDVFHVQALHPARNLAARSDRFEIDAADHIAAQKAARANGRSHHRLLSFASRMARPDRRTPTGAGAAQNDFLWVIVAGQELGCFVYRDGGFLSCVTGAD